MNICPACGKQQINGSLHNCDPLSVAERQRQAAVAFYACDCKSQLDRIEAMLKEIIEGREGEMSKFKVGEIAVYTNFVNSPEENGKECEIVSEPYMKYGYYGYDVIDDEFCNKTDSKSGEWFVPESKLRKNIRQKNNYQHGTK